MRGQLTWAIDFRFSPPSPMANGAVLCWETSVSDSICLFGDVRQSFALRVAPRSDAMRTALAQSGSWSNRFGAGRDGGNRMGKLAVPFAARRRAAGSAAPKPAQRPVAHLGVRSRDLESVATWRSATPASRPPTAPASRSARHADSDSPAAWVLPGPRRWTDSGHGCRKTQSRPSRRAAPPPAP